MERKWWTLLTVCIATFMLLLDITVVTVALPAMQATLHSSFADLQWVLDAYALTLASFLLTAGVLGDMFGRRGVYAAGLGLFMAASLACGLSTSPLMLVLSRGAQGVGAAVLFATGLALLAQTFTGPDRGLAFGIYGSILGAAVAVGPLVGGAVTTGIDWRWIFFLNLPLGVLALALVPFSTRAPRPAVRRRIDWAGFVAFTASLFMLVYALVKGNALGWRSPTILSLLVGSAALMVLFLAVEWRRRDKTGRPRHRHAAARRPQPMLDLSLFRRPALSGVSIAAFALPASLFAMFLYLTLYLEEVLGYSAVGTGLRLLPVTVLAFLTAPLAGRLSTVVKSRYLLGLGLLLVALGCELMTRVQVGSGWTVLLPGFVAAGVGVGLTNPVIASATVSVVAPERSGMASGVSSTFRQVGFATGVAAFGAIFVHEMRSATVRSLLGSTAGQQLLHHGGEVGTVVSQGVVRQALPGLPSAEMQHALLRAYQSAFVSTFDHLMAVAAVVAAAGALGALALVRQRDFLPSAAPGAALSAPRIAVNGGPVPAAAMPAVPGVPAAPAAPAAPEDPAASEAAEPLPASPRR